ncbi:hypothetical protein VPH35_009673 [Triticum aestivum]
MDRDFSAPRGGLEVEPCPATPRCRGETHPATATLPHLLSSPRIQKEHMVQPPPPLPWIHGARGVTRGPLSSVASSGQPLLGGSLLQGPDAGASLLQGPDARARYILPFSILLTSPCPLTSNTSFGHRRNRRARSSSVPVLNLHKKARYQRSQEHAMMFNSGEDAHAVQKGITCFFVGFWLEI